MNIQIKSNFLVDISLGILLVLMSSPIVISYLPINYISLFLSFIIIPGHFLILSIFPRKIAPSETISFYENTSRYPRGLERLLMAIFCSMALSSVAVFVVTYYINVQITYSESLQLLNLILILTAIIRTMQVQEEDRYFWELSLEVPSRSNSGNNDLALMASLLIMLTYSISLFTPVVPSIGEPEEFTEFYILGPEVLAKDYPTNIGDGDSLSIFIGIENHESSDEIYILQISKSRYDRDTGNIHSYTPESFDTELLEEFQILDGEQLLLPYSTVFDSPGLWVLEFDLFISSSGPNSHPYRELQLNIDVT